MTEKLKIIIDVDGKKATNTINGVTKSLKGNEKAAKGASSALGGMAGKLLALASAAAVVNELKNITKAGVSMQRMMNTLEVATGDATDAMVFMRGEAERLGLDLESSTQAFGKLSAAAQGTALEGEEVRRIFSSIATASTAMGLSAEQTGGALTALEQMISKGTVQAEELRGQLGERLPGAFQIAAKSMGVTTKELGKMLEQGEVLAEDLLPKLATELENRFGAGADSASHQANAEFNRLSTSMFELRNAIAESGVLDAIAEMAKGLGEMADSATDLIKVNTGSDMDQALGKLSDLNEQYSELSDKIFNREAAGIEGGSYSTTLKNRARILLDTIEKQELYIELLKIGQVTNYYDAIVAGATRAEAKLIALGQAQADSFIDTSEPSSGGGDDADPVVDKEAIRAQKILDIHVKKFERIAEMSDLATLDDEERAIAEFDKKLEALDAEKEFLLSKDAWNLEREQAYINARNDIIEKGEAEVAKTRAVAQTEAARFALAVQKGEIKGILGGLTQMTAGLAQHNRASFEANKAFALAKAGVNIVLGLSEALKLPFPLNIAQGAYVAATGAGQIASIQSASFGGGGSIPTSQGGSAGGIPSQQVQPSPNSTGQTSQASTQDVNITLTSGIYDATAVRDLIESINEQTADGVRLNVRLSA